MEASVRLEIEFTENDIKSLVDNEAKRIANEKGFSVMFSKGGIELTCDELVYYCQPTS